MHYTKSYDSPIGTLYLSCNETAISELSFHGSNVQTNHPLLDIAFEQLDEYFDGGRRIFTLPLSINGTEFQRQVYTALLTIEYGKTVSYESIAQSIENPKACRAVGMANNRNRLAILVPCHRVVGKNGSLIGYAGGLEKKKWLLDFERNHA